MSVYASIIAGARSLAGIPVELSKKASQRLKWFDYYESHNHNVSPADILASVRRPFGGAQGKLFYRWKRRYAPHHLKSLEDHTPPQRWWATAGTREEWYLCS